MRVTCVAFFTLGCLFLGQAAHAAPGKGRFQIEKDQGKTVAISMHNQVSVRAGGQIVMHDMGNPGTLTRLGATRLISATPIGKGRFAIQASVAPNTPLARMIKVMSKHDAKSAPASLEGVATERFRIGQPNGQGPGVNASITVLTGMSALESQYAKKVFGPNAPSFHQWANTPLR